MYSIEIDHIQKNYQDVAALKGISFNIEEGEFFGLLGPNGAGKTTLISILAGLVRATSGTARIHGHDVVDDFRVARRMVGIVPQELVFDPFFSVREILRLQSGYYGLRNNEAWIDEIMHHLDLTDKANSNMRTLSGGMKRRVLVAQALVHRPPVIVLDEPTAGVDVGLRQTLWQFIARLNKEGHTIVLTTHYLEEAEQLCDRIAMLRNGEVVALDHKPNLLKRFSSNQLVISLSGLLPESLRVLEVNPIPDRAQSALNQSKRYILQLESVGQIESILAQCREAGCQLEEVEMRQTDLEHVFLQVMKSAPADQGDPRHVKSDKKLVEKEAEQKLEHKSKPAPASKAKIAKSLSDGKVRAKSTDKAVSQTVKKNSTPADKESSPKKRSTTKDKALATSKEAK